jgi:allophanate hydrolase
MPSVEDLNLTTLSQRYQSGELDPHQVLEDVLARIDRYPQTAIWIERFSAQEIRSQLDAALRRKAAGIAQPLLGIPFAIKDNIDMAGHRTTAACPAFGYVPQKSATVVQRLCDAGAIAVGKTNLDQFATGLVGTRSPYGVVKNPFDARYISGGSSSGSAVAVAAGLVSFALATDTAGSGRVPAALNNIVGLKPSCGLISTAGAVPACKSLDCIAVLALTCEDAQAVMQIAQSPDAADPYSRAAKDFSAVSAFPQSRFRFGVPAESELHFFGNSEMAAIYRASIERMRALGGTGVEIDYRPFSQAAALLYGGPWVAERYIVARDLMESQPDALLPIIRSILGGAANITAAETFEAIYKLQSFRQLAKAEWAKMDLLLLPTTGTTYTIAEVEAEPISLNVNLGYYTNFVNLLDLCAVAVPGGFQSNGLPAGVSLIAPAGSDQSLWNIADALHRSLKVGTGVGKNPIPQSRRPIMSTTQKLAKLAVVGAHLSGMPLNHQLTDIGAVLVRKAKTAPCYRLFALPGTVPPKPGLVRVSDPTGVAIELEVWEMSLEAFGGFVAAIPPPLGIGTVLLDDGQAVQAFLCESYAVEGARDISKFGGWRAFLKGA